METNGHYLRQTGQTVHVINHLQSDKERHHYSFQALLSSCPENIVVLRQFCRQRFFVVDIASDFKRKKLFPNTNYSTPEDMLSVDSQKFADLLNKTSLRNFLLCPSSSLTQNFTLNRVSQARVKIFLSITTVNGLHFRKPPRKQE